VNQCEHIVQLVNVRAEVSRSAPAHASTSADLLTAGIALLALYQLGLAVFMAVSPHTFFTSVGPFGTLNQHYIRDTATFSAALGVGLAVALWRPSWRVPVLAVVFVQFALHSVNHLVDIGAAHPSWTGYFDFFSLLLSTFLILGLLVLARRQADEGTRKEGDPR
jgi:hypothetical protein